jgi:tripartite-type tricarboxylate transporter receptor subunit TctC
MIKYVFCLLMLLSGYQINAETIKIYSPYGPGHSATPALFRVVDQANQDQSKYRFLVEFKPGGNQLIAVKSLDENSLAIIAPAYVENIQTGKLNINDYVPLHAFGDACWAVVTNKTLENQKEFVVGGVGFGNAAHLTALALGEKHGFNIRYIVFKSNNDALLNMAGNNGVEFVIDKYESYESLKIKNDRLRMIAASCPARLPQQPDIKTLRELGIDAPLIFNITIAQQAMPQNKREDIAKILHTATEKIGAHEIYRLSAMRPPQFDGIPVHVFYNNAIKQIQKLQTKYRDEIGAASK